MRIEKKSMNWLPRPSAWNHQLELAAKRREQAQAFMADQQALSSSLSAVRESIFTGQAELAAKAALARVKAKLA